MVKNRSWVSRFIGRHSTEMEKELLQGQAMRVSLLWASSYLTYLKKKQEILSLFFTTLPLHLEAISGIDPINCGLSYLSAYQSLHNNCVDPIFSLDPELLPGTALGLVSCCCTINSRPCYEQVLRMLNY